VALPVVPPEEVLRDVVRDEDVGVAVLVDIEGNDPHAPALSPRDARLSSEVAEGPVPLVPVEDVLLGLVVLRGAVQGNRTSEVGSRVLGIELQVVGDVEVEVAVALDVEEGATGTAAGIVDSGLARDIAEGPVPFVPEEDVRSPVRDVEIEVAVPVVVACGNPEAEAGVARPRGQGDVLEAPVPQVAPEAVPRGRIGAGAIDRGPVQEVEVLIAVPVVVEESEAARVGLDDVVATCTAIEVPERDAGGGGPIGEVEGRVAAGRSRPGRVALEEPEAAGDAEAAEAPESGDEKQDQEKEPARRGEDPGRPPSLRGPGGVSRKGTRILRL
jgi:hypothetical protein